LKKDSLFKVGFVTDHRFFMKNDKIYSIAFNNSIVERYMTYAADLTIVAHSLISEDSMDDIAELSVPNVFFEFLPILNPTPKGLISKYRERVSRLRIILEKLDFIIVRLPSINGLQVLHIARGMKKPCLVEVVGDIREVGKSRRTLQGRLLAKFQYYGIRRSVRDSTHVIYVTTKFLQSEYPTKGTSVGISNVSLPIVNNSVLDSRVQRIKGCKECIIIGLIGSPLSKRKGFFILLEAMKEVIQSLKINVTLEVVGKAENELVKNLIDQFQLGPYVSYIGTLEPGKQVLNWLDGIDIYVQPSLSEGLPRALIEAMSRGLPCLGSSAGGIPELLQEAQLHDPGDFNKLSNDLIEIIKSKLLMEKLAVENYEKSKEYYEESLQSKRNLFIKDFLHKRIGLQ
jgi:glycosyltransferase involved in cell wall biosynthesis